MMPVARERPLLHLFSLSLLIATTFCSSTAYCAESRVTQARSLRQQCSFTDGSTITLGANALNSNNPDQNSYRTGEYIAMPLRVSEHIVIPPLSNPIDIPSGTYTLFVTDLSKPPATIIISKKTGAWGMPYPGPQYDLGRTLLGSDFDQSLVGSRSGCRQTPMMLWIQSDHYVAYAKVLTAKSRGGKVEYF